MNFKRTSAVPCGCNFHRFAEGPDKEIFNAFVNDLHHSSRLRYNTVIITEIANLGQPAVTS